MSSNKLMPGVRLNGRTRIRASQLAKLCPLLAIIMLILLAAAVLSFSALATVADCWRQAAVPQLLELEDSDMAGPRQRFLQHNDTAENGQLALYALDSTLPLASLTAWPLSEGVGPAAPFYASPQPFDSNYDGVVDHLFSIDFTGRVWLTGITAAGFGSTLLLADLASSEWRFIGSLGVFEVSLPLLLRPDGLQGRHKLLLLIARNITNGEDAIVSLRLPTVIVAASLLRFDTLVDRSVLSATEREYGLSNEQWFSLLNGAGWWARLSGQLTQPPQVVAGVIYSAVATSDFSALACATEAAEHSVVAMHLHSAGLVYNQRRFRLESGVGKLTLQQQTDGTAALILNSVTEQHTALTELVSLSPDCLECTAPLRLDQFPRWIKLATYRQETGAH
jgi:hypothetical protein